MLKLKPVLQIQGEKLDAFAKVRGKKQARRTMLKAMKADFEGRFAPFVQNGDDLRKGIVVAVRHNGGAAVFHGVHAVGRGKSLRRHGQHGKVVQMNIGIAVRVGDFIIVNFGEPVVCRNRSGVGKDQSADGIGDCGVFLDAPVADFQVVVHRCLVIKRGGRDGAEFFTLAAVQNISLGNVGVTRLYKHRFHAVLNIFDGDQPLFDLGLEIRRDFQGDVSSAYRRTFRCIAQALRQAVHSARRRIQQLSHPQDKSVYTGFQGSERKTRDFLRCIPT